MAHQRRDTPTRLTTPDLDRAIVAPAHHPQLVGCDRPDTFNVTKKRAGRLARLDVPDANGVVQAPGDEERVLPQGVNTIDACQTREWSLKN